RGEGRRAAASAYLAKTRPCSADVIHRARLFVPYAPERPEFRALGTNRRAFAGAGGGSAAERGEPGLFVGRYRRLDDRVERAVHHLIEVVRLVPRAMIGDAVLGEVVGADALGAVHPADLRATGIGCRSIQLLLLPGQ